MGGKNSPCPHGNRTPPPLRGTAPSINLAGAEDRRTAPLRTQAGAGERTPPLPPPQELHPTYPRPRSWPGPGPGGAGGCAQGKERRRWRCDVRKLHQCGQAHQPPFYSVPSNHVPQVRPTRTHPAQLSQLKSIGRLQQQYRDERRVPVRSDLFRLDQQRHGC